MLRRLGGIFAGLLVGLLLAPLGIFWVAFVPHDEALSFLSILFAVLGVAFLFAAALWMLFLEQFYRGIERKRAVRAFLALGGSFPFLSGSLLVLWSAFGQTFFWGSVLVAIYGFYQLALALQGPQATALDPNQRLERRGWRRAPVLHSTVDGLAAMVEFETTWEGEALSFHSVASKLPADALEIVPSTVIRRFVGGGEKTGDAIFDAATHVGGDRTLVLSLLTSSARAAISSVIEGGGMLTAGQWRSGNNLLLATLAHASHELTQKGTAPDALRVNATTDPVPEVRLACLEQLLTLEGVAAQIADACRTACADRDVRVRVLAASWLLAGADLADREHAEKALASSPAALGADVAGLLDHADGAIAAALLRVLAERGGSDARPALGRFALRMGKHDALRGAAAAAIANINERAADGHGRISLSEEDGAAGALSEADGAGHLTIAKAARKVGPARGPAG